MKYFIIKKRKKYTVQCRLAALILCFALCMESSSIQAFAAEEGSGSGAIAQSTDDMSEADNTEKEDSVSDEEKDPEVGEDADPEPGEDAGSEPGEDADLEAGEDAGSEPGEDADPEVDEDAGSEPGEDADPEVDEDAGSEPGEDADPEPGEDADPEQDEDTGSVSGNDADSVSENDLASVSENDLQSVSENSLDAEKEAMIREAEDAFARLLAGKDLMALLYHTDTYQSRRMPEEDSESVAALRSGQTLYVNGLTITEEDVWYEVRFWQDGVEGTGYVQSYYLAYSDEDWLAWEEAYLVPILQSGDEYAYSAYGMSSYSMMPYAIDTSDITAFPGAYQSALRSLKNAHPNWTFVPMNTGLDFNTAVSKEMGDKSLIQNLTANASKGWVGAPCPSESGWYYATKPAVAYHMDPRNFLTETYIFQFEQLTFNGSYHTQASVQSFLNGTFMKGALPDDSARRTYAQAFFEIGKNRKLSPIHLASRVYQEQGKGNSGLISGTYPGYEGYYNFFNVGVNGASTAEKIVKGLKYAKEKGWNTRYKSLEGGAATIGNNYILKYQDTIYLEKFNVDKNSPYGIYNHQYMQNIQAPASESSSTKKMYANAGSLNSAFVFKIPVYQNMPDDQYYPALSLNKTSLTLDRSREDDLEKGQQLKLYVDGIEVNPAEASWKSSDPALVKVEAGLVKIAGDGSSAKAGEAVVTASYQDVETSCKVKVEISLQEITLDKTGIALRRPDTVVEDETGLSEAEKKENTDTASVQVSFVPPDTTADTTITWSSSNTKVAKVSADPEDSSRAVVTAVGKGEAVITAKASKAGSSPVRTASCQVRVSAPIYQAALTNPNANDTDGQTTLLAGQGVNLAAEYWPKDTTSDTQITWSSSDDKVATVRNGSVKALSKGKAVITARMAGCEQGYMAQHTVLVEECSVIFMKKDGETILKNQQALYGAVLPEQDFPEAEEAEGSLFIGWYTGKNGTGSRFDRTTAVYQQETMVYPYYEEQGKGFYVLPVGDQIYTGSAVKPEVQVYDSVSCGDGSRELIALEQGRDYTVSYKNNKKVSIDGRAMPQITVKGKGNYKGTETVSFRILPKALTDTDITADHITAAYSGRTIKSSPAVYRDGKKLKKNTDYTVTYPQTGTGAYQTAGTYPIRITGKGGYTGTITVYETITQKILLSKVTIEKIPAQTYSNALVDKEQGIGIRPESLKVSYRKEPLVESADGGMTGDYTVSYTNNTAVGTATATITAVEGSAYAGSRSVTYKIVGTSLARAAVEGLENKEYTGREEDVRQTPGACRLVLDGRELTESTDGGVTGDYVVSYSNISKAGTASILFKGINEYTGQIKKTYKITACQLGSSETGINPAITLQYYTQDAPDRLQQISNLSQIVTPYMKGGSKPAVVLTFQGIELVQGKDFTVKYANNKAVTPTGAEGADERKLPKITVTGKGNYKGSITGFFRITDGRLAQDNGKLTMTAKDVVYQDKKNAYKSSVVLTDCNGAKLSAGKDYDRNLAYTYAEDAYVRVKDVTTGTKSVENGAADDYDSDVILKKAGETVEADDIPQAGTKIRVTARGTGFYAGDGTAEISAVYRIVKADIARAKVKVQAKEYNNGKAVTLTEEDLALTVNGSPAPLQYGTDYSIDETTYDKNLNKGKASVTVRGLGNYGGEKKITYTIGAKLLVWWKNLFYKN